MPVIKIIYNDIPLQIGESFKESKKLKTPNAGDYERAVPLMTEVSSNT